MNEARLILEPLLYRQGFEVEPIAASCAEHRFTGWRIFRGFSRGPPRRIITKHFGGYPLRVDAKADEYVGGEFARGGQVCCIPDLPRELHFIVAHREEIGGDVMTSFMQERCGDCRGVMSAVDADERAFLETGVFAEVETHNGKAARPRHARDLKDGAEFVRKPDIFLVGAEPDGVMVEMRPSLTLSFVDDVAYFGAAKA